MSRLRVLTLLSVLSTLPAQAVETPYFRFGKGDPSGTAGGVPALAATSTGMPGSGTTLGAPVSARFVPSGGQAPYGYALVPGSTLPDGVSLGQDGSLAGNAMSAGPYSGAVRITDAAGTKADQAYAFDIVPPPPDMEALQPVTTVAGLPVSLAASLRSSAFGPYVFTLLDASRAPAPLPSGWTNASFTSTSGSLAGTLPSSPGTWGPYYVRVTDRYGQSAVAGPATVTGQALAVTLPSSLTAREGDAARFVATTNHPAPAWSISGDATWLTVSANGMLSGDAPDVAVATGYPFTVTVTGMGVTGSASGIVTVQPHTVTVAGVGTSYDIGSTVSATATTSFPDSVAWSLVGAPSWLSISPSGAISGQAAAPAGTIGGITAVATRNGIKASSAPFSVTVNAPPAANARVPVAVTGLVSNTQSDINRLYDGNDSTSVGVSGQTIVEYTFSAAVTASGVDFSIVYSGPGNTFYTEYLDASGTWRNASKYAGGTYPLYAFGGQSFTNSTASNNTDFGQQVVSTKFRLRAVNSWSGSLRGFKIN